MRRRGGAARRGVGWCGAARGLPAEVRRPESHGRYTHGDLHWGGRPPHRSPHRARSRTAGVAAQPCGRPQGGSARGQLSALPHACGTPRRTGCVIGRTARWGRSLRAQPVSRARHPAGLRRRPGPPRGSEHAQRPARQRKADHVAPRAPRRRADDSGGHVRVAASRGAVLELVEREPSVAGIDSVSRLGDFDLNAVSPDYFATMGTRILRGRGVSAQDIRAAPQVMVVSDAMAKALWPGQDAIGQCVKVGADTTPCRYVVGVAENIKSQRLGDDRTLFYYLSAAQWHPEKGGLFLRVRGDGARSAEAIRRRLQQLMPGTSYVTVTPLREILGEQTRSWELGATMFLAFGALALVLAAIGLYSVIAYNVAQRAQELGVRAALGAQQKDLVRLVLNEGLKMATVGIVIGVVIALAGGQWLGPLLFQESPHDPLVFGFVALLLLGVTVAASVVPSRRAARVDPIVALRYE